MPAGQPAAVLLYTLAPEKMIGWPHSPNPAAKNLLGPSIAGLPELAPLVRDGKVQVEQIQDARPDVILDYGSTAPRYADRATMVQAATGIPVLLLDGKLERTPEIYRRLGAILGTEERAADLAAAADRLLAITRERAQARREARPIRVYYARSADGLTTATVASSLSDVLRQVTASLQLRDDEQNADQMPQRAGGRRLAPQLLPDQELDLGCEIVDRLVAFDHT